MQINYELLGILIAVIIQGLCLAFKIGKFEEKLDALEKKQDKHNNLMERTFCCEKEISVIKEKIDVEFSIFAKGAISLCGHGKNSTSSI